MTRRLFFALPAIALPDTPRNRLSNAGNEFNQQYARWAEQMNTKVGTINAAAVQAFEPLPNLWRRVERLFTAWVRGF